VQRMMQRMSRMRGGRIDGSLRSWAIQVEGMHDMTEVEIVPCPDSSSRLLAT
jgi:hypothetical protein